MSALPVIAIFDVGKTNKKLFLFDENYEIVFEKSARFTDIADEEGDPCENLASLTSSVIDSLEEVNQKTEFYLKAVNFSTYGASLVHLDENGIPVTPLYNYLKPYPAELSKKFYKTYGGEEEFSKLTASPVLGNLNSGMQLYWLKYRKPGAYAAIKHSLHLPQYLSYLVTGQFFSDITSIGCHTNLWNFRKNQYHDWVFQEKIFEKLAPIAAGDHIMPAIIKTAEYKAGIGLHDSSSALIPYLVNFNEPFVLISTGTWCISLNPFNNEPLTGEELTYDCLTYFTFRGKPVKASRLFAGNEHDTQLERICDFYHQGTARYKAMEYNAGIIKALKQKIPVVTTPVDRREILKTSLFADRELAGFNNDEEAYHQLMLDIVTQQYESTQLVLKGIPVKRIFVDGGFSNNEIYMRLLASLFPGLEVYAASMAQATALGAALAIHDYWNTKPLPPNLIELKYYSFNGEVN